MEANVRSIETLETFRAQLIVFLTKARRSVDQINEEVNRTRSWIINEQRTHWQNEFKRRTRVLEQAEAELVTARYSTLRVTTTTQEMAVRKAKQALKEAEEKLQRIKAWTRNFDNAIDPSLKKLESLRSYLDHDVPKAIQHVAQTQRALLAYTDKLPSLDQPSSSSSSNELDSSIDAESSSEP